MTDPAPRGSSSPDSDDGIAASGGWIGDRRHRTIHLTGESLNTLLHELAVDYLSNRFYYTDHRYGFAVVNPVGVVP